MNKRVVYTAIYGSKDVLKDPLHVSESFDYVCFTNDEDMKSNIWKVVHKEETHKDPVRSAKIFKVKPHEYLSEYDTSIWVDANFIIKNDLDSFLGKCSNLKDANMLLFQHDRGRNCIYDEAKIIIDNQIDDPDIVKKQIQKYKKEGYPAQRGLSANSIILKTHNDNDMIKLADMWWDEISQFSRRDQLSLYYCNWKLDIKYYLMEYPDTDIRNNHWFQWLPHKYELQRWY